MSDFSQNGIISTLHDFNTKSTSTIESELSKFSKQRKMELILPCLYSELEGTALPKIIEEIKNFNIKNEALYPKYLPMLMPPREWENPFVGGYYGKKHNYKQQSAKEISNTLSNSKEK